MYIHYIYDLYNLNRGINKAVSGLIFVSLEAQKKSEKRILAEKNM